MTGTGVVRFIFIRNCRSTMLGLRLLQLFLAGFDWLTSISLPSESYQVEMAYVSEYFFLSFWYIFFFDIFWLEKLDVLDDDVPSDIMNHEFSTLLYRPCGQLSHELFVLCGWYVYRYGSSVSHFASCVSQFGWYVKIRMSSVQSGLSTNLKPNQMIRTVRQIFLKCPELFVPSCTLPNFHALYTRYEWNSSTFLESILESDSQKFGPCQTGV